MSAPPAQPAQTPAAPRPGSRDLPLSVCQLVRGSSRVLERTVGTVYVTGEVASLVRAASGHLYFALTDDKAQIRCVMWRSDAARLRFRVENGAALLCRGRLGIFERDGKFQLYVTGAEPSGLGADALALKQLKEKLAAEGLMAEERKRPLPLLPRRIGVATSRTGAAIRDIVQAVQRRFPVPILVSDCRVQGDHAARSIVRAVRALAETDVDVIIVGRGGGSASDLSAFNDEELARAIAAAPVPVISAVGHEVDISIADLIADKRAATPTMAGEMAVPVRDELLSALQKEERRLARELLHRLRDERQSLDHLSTAAARAWEGSLSRRRQELAQLRGAVEQSHPRARIAGDRTELAELGGRLRAQGREVLSGARDLLDDLEHRMITHSCSSIESRKTELSNLAGRLQAMSPLAVLERGYSIATREGAAVRSAAEVNVGDALDLRLARGRLSCVVKTVADEQE